jgi:hypothetical protein
MTRVSSPELTRVFFFLRVVGGLSCESSESFCLPVKAGRQASGANQQGGDSRYDFRQLRIGDSTNQRDAACLPTSAPKSVSSCDCEDRQLPLRPKVARRAFHDSAMKHLAPRPRSLPAINKGDG